MAEIKKQFADTVEKDGKLYTEAAGPEEGKAGAKVVAEFEDTREDENGNLIASGRKSNLPDTEGHAGAKVVKQFDDTIDHGDYLEAVPKPDFAKD